MARRTLSFVCQNCGAVYGRWQGKCEACGEWNTIAEEGGAANAAPGRAARKGRPFALEPLAGAAHEAPRLASGLAELDRVTGGGFVRGSVLLVGGDPGIGKSTLLIQAAAELAKAGHRVVYISGEEAVAQVRLRAERLGLTGAKVELAAETSVEDIVATLGEGKAPRLVVIDSIQTMWTGAVDSAPGTVTQVRGAAQALIRFAKRSGAAVFLVGHVTKDGQIAGPRVVEHMVDAVLSFEGDGSHQFRILRAVKNRFGPTDEIGVFEMTGSGLREVTNPSELFLSERNLGSRAGPWSAGTRTACRWCLPCWRRTAPCGSAATTFTLTSPAGCASRSRRLISRRRRRSYPPSPMRPCRPTRSTSARYRFRARCGRWRRPRHASRRRPSSALPARSYRKVGAKLRPKPE
jgi:DNA repair protein RadA/Sms